PAVQRTILNIARHLLRPDQRTLDLRIIDGRVIAATGEGDLVAGRAEQCRGRLLQTACGDAEFEDLLTHFRYTCFGSKTLSPTTFHSSPSTRRKKQEA